MKINLYELKVSHENLYVAKGSRENLYVAKVTMKINDHQVMTL